MHKAYDLSIPSLHAYSRSDQGIGNLDLYHSIPEVLEGYTAQVLHDPIGPRCLNLLNAVGRSQSDDLETSSFARTDSRRRIFKHDHVRLIRQPQSLAAKQIAIGVRFSLLNVFRHHNAAGVSQLEDLDPSVEKGPRSRSAHCPGRIDALEVRK